MTQTRHNDRAARRKKLLDFLCGELEDQMRQLEKLIQQRIQLVPSHAVSPWEAVEEAQRTSPESSSAERATAEIEVVEPEPATPSERESDVPSEEKMRSIPPEPSSQEVPTPEIEAIEPEPSAPSEGPMPGTYAMMTPTLADIYASQGLIREATSVLEKILRQEPEREDVRSRLEHLKLKSSESENRNENDRTDTET